MKTRSLFYLLAFASLLPSAAAALTTRPPADAPSVTLRSDVPTGSVVTPGESMSFRLRVSHDAAVVVLDIDTEGEVHLLYPVDAVQTILARQTLRLPENGTDLMVDGARGVEFVFALAVPDPAAIDDAQLARLRDSENGPEPYRVEGDPFLAVNKIAGDLVHDVASTSASFGYTYFYVSQRVDHPCYLCGPCAEASDTDQCSQHVFAQRFDRRTPLTYPLDRGYEAEDVASVSGGAQTPSSAAAEGDSDDVVVNFYPYGTEVRYIDPCRIAYDGGELYDPFFWNYPGWYPYYPGWSVSIGFGSGWGWGWGPWGGYYCSGWYNPWHYRPWWNGYYSCGYPSYGRHAVRYKEMYKSGAQSFKSSLAANHTFAAQRDGALRIAAADVRPSLRRTGGATYKSRSTVAWKGPVTRTGYFGMKSRTRFDSRTYGTYWKPFGRVSGQPIYGRRGYYGPPYQKPVFRPRMRSGSSQPWRSWNPGAVRSRSSGHSSGSRPAVHYKSGGSSARASHGGSHAGSRGRGKGR
jgi:Domain of unknown function (DUF4384)